jgi:hypothetical protein
MATPANPAPTPIPERAVPVAPSTPDTTDWPKQATDSIVKVVDSVRDKTTGPAVRAARAVVYYSILGALALPFFILALIGTMRVAERGLIMLGEKLGWSFLYEPMWLVYLIFGLIFFFTGTWLWRKARQPASAAA